MIDRDEDGSDGEARRLEEEARALEAKAREFEKEEHKLEEKAHELRDRAHEIEDGEHHHHDRDHGFAITVVVNGQPLEIEVRADEHLAAIRAKALQDTGNVAQPPESWEFKTEAGVILDAQSTVGTIGLHAGAVLFLSLKAGVAGG